MKIWGFRASGLGDILMVEPLLRYYEKLHPGSYKYWVINKKCSQVAPLFINHPLIDKIIVTENWHDFGKNDLQLRDACDIIIDVNPPQVDPYNWMNYMCAQEESFKMAGIYDIDAVLTKEEQHPKLYKWFLDYSSSNNANNTGYHFFETKTICKQKTIGIFPFAKYGSLEKRSPSPGWWSVFIELAIQSGYNVKHFGWITEPSIGASEKHCDKTYFDQIRMALECDIVIGTDTGTLWILGAYKHPTICLSTYHMPYHVKNELAFIPTNDNGKLLFNEKNINLIKQKDVLKLAIEIMNNV